MIRRRILMTGIAAFALCCSDTTGPPAAADVEGVYQLVELNGELLPYDDQPHGCCIYTAGSLTIEPDRYELAISFRNKNNGMVATSGEFGSYRVDGRAITFDWAGGDFHHRLHDAQIEGDSIRLRLGGDAPGADDQFRAVFSK